jgi:hypothetical protein
MLVLLKCWGFWLTASEPDCGKLSALFGETDSEGVKQIDLLEDTPRAFLVVVVVVYHQYP